MKNMVKILGVFGILITAGFTSNIQAQDTNVIKEVKINSNDGFGELRNLVMQNFDFTNPEFTEGKINSTVTFEVAENGRISHVAFYYGGGKLIHATNPRDGVKITPARWFGNIAGIVRLPNL